MNTPRKRTWKRRLLLAAMAVGVALVAISIFLVIAELILRSRSDHRLAVLNEIRYLFQLDEQGGIVTARNWSGAQTIEGRTAAIHTNNLGLRRPDDIAAKAAKEKRILVIGDSMVFGQGVADDETFCALMEENWTQSGAKVVVGNGGRTGSGIRDQQAPLRRLLPEFEPDLVVSCIYMGNDFIDNLSDRTVVDGFPLVGSEASLARESWRFRLTYSSFVAFEVESFLFKHLPSLAVTIPSPADSVLPSPLKGSMAVYTEGFFMDRIAPLPPHVQTLWSLTETHIRELRDLAAPTPLAVVIIPTSLHVIPDHYEKFRDRDDVNLDPKQHRRGEAQRRFVEMGKRLGIPVFDLTPLLEKGPDQAADWLPTDRHFSIHGHRRVAQWLQPWLDAM